MYNEGRRVIKAHLAVAAPALGSVEPGLVDRGFVLPLPGEECAAAQGALDASQVAAALVEKRERPHQASGLVANVTLEEARRRAEALENRARLLLLEAEEAGHARLAESEQRAREIVRQAEAEVEALHRQVREAAAAEGRSAGYREGVQAGREEAEALLQQAHMDAQNRLDQARQEAEEVVCQADQERNQTIAALEPELVRLALDIARQIVRSELSLRPEAIVGMVAAGLSKLRGEEHMRVRIHPEDLAILQERRADLLVAAGSSDLEFVSDPGFSRGGFVLHTEQGIIDGRLEAQFSEAAAALDPVELGKGV